MTRKTNLGSVRAALSAGTTMTGCHGRVADYTAFRDDATMPLVDSPEI